MNIECSGPYLYCTKGLTNAGVAPQYASAIAAWGCAATYALSVGLNGLNYVSSYRGRLLHAGCTFGGRTRVVNRGKPGNLEVDVLGMLQGTAISLAQHFNFQRDEIDSPEILLKLYWTKNLTSADICAP